jgi:hypothetical protein
MSFIANVTSHSNVLQEQRFWPHNEKYTGLNGNFLAFMGEIRKEMIWQQMKVGDKTRHYKVVGRAIKFVEIICNYKPQASEDMKKNKTLQFLRGVIRDRPLPKRNNNDIEDIAITIEIDGVEYTENCDSDIETAPRDTVGFPRGWCNNRDERDVSEYIKNVIDSAVDGPAKEVITSMGMPRDRTGFQTIERLADVYGRNSGHLMMLPHRFVWGDKTLANDWVAYKHLLDGQEYLISHPSCENMMIQCAMMGFLKYGDSWRLTDHIRTSVGETPSWESFKEAVNKFLGDTYRYQFERSMINNDNGLQAMTAASVIIPQSEEGYINYIDNQLRGQNFKGSNKKKGNWQKHDKSNNASSNLKPVPKTANTESIPNKSKNKKKICAWCSESHQTFQCKTHGNGKWDKHKCSRCKGIGHPVEACVNPK